MRLGTGVRRTTFSLAGRTLAVDVRDDAAAHILQTTYADARVQGPRAVHHNASMRRLGDGRLDVRFDRSTVVFGDAGNTQPLLSAYYAGKELFARFAVAHPAGIAFYGALVEIAGAAVLILGPTSIGKTLLAVHLVARGARFLGDETAVLDFHSGKISALARRPALREAALALLPTDDMRARVARSAHVLRTERGRFWYALGPEDLGGIAPCARPCSLGAVFVIRERRAIFAMRRLDLTQSMPMLMQRTYLPPSQLAQLSGLRRAMRGIPQYEVALAEPRDSAVGVLDEVRACV